MRGANPSNGLSHYACLPVPASCPLTAEDLSLICLGMKEMNWRRAMGRRLRVERCACSASAAARPASIWRCCSRRQTRGTSSGSSSATGRTTRSAGASCSPTTRSAISRRPIPRPAREIAGCVQSLGRHRRPFQRAARSPRAATASAGSAASGCSTSCSARCEALGVELVFETDVTDDAPRLPRFRADLVIASDGINSRVRDALRATHSRPTSTSAAAGSSGSAPGSRSRRSRSRSSRPRMGWFQAHAYQYDGDTSTFIVETPEDVWQKAGLERMSQEEGIAFCERLFAPLPRRRAADEQRRRTCAGRRSGSAFRASSAAPGCTGANVDGRAVPIVLMGDAAHTAHFSIGSGTKLALEDAHRARARAARARATCAQRSARTRARARASKC